MALYPLGFGVVVEGGDQTLLVVASGLRLLRIHKLKYQAGSLERTHLTNLMLKHHSLAAQHTVCTSVSPVCLVAVWDPQLEVPAQLLRRMHHRSLAKKKSECKTLLSAD